MTPSIRSLLLLILLLTSSASFAQSAYEQALVEKSQEAKHVRGDKLRAYRITPLGSPIQIDIPDTITYGTHRLVAPEGRSLGIAYTGNVNTPWQSKVFFDRKAQQEDFFYTTGYQGMLYSPDNVPFYDTRTPFTFVHYRKGFSDDTMEEVLQGTLSFNLGKSLNLGISADYTSANGFYASNRSRNVDYRLFGSYRSDRYDLWAYLANDYYKHTENAGISNTDYILNPDSYSSGRVRITSLDVPVHLRGDLLYNRIRVGHGFVSHRYKLGHKKVVHIIDSAAVHHNMDAERREEQGFVNSSPEEPAKPLVRDSTVFIPVGSLSHQLYYNTFSRRMISRTQDERWLTFFGMPTANRIISTDSDGNRILTGVLPNDTAALSVLHNRLSLSLIEGFRPWVKAGLTGYIRTENYWISNPDSTNKSYKNTERFFSTFVGGELSRQTGEGLNFSFGGEVGLLGKDLGAFSLLGDIHTRFKLGGYEFSLSTDGKLLNSRPSYFSAHHHGTWGWWDKKFDFVRRLELGGRIDLSSWGAWAELRTASLQNQIYWTRNGAHQHTQLLQISMLRAGNKGKYGPLGWRIEAAYQLSSDKDIIPLPNLTTHGDIYLDFYVARVLQVHLGLEGYWHTSYYAPYYLPSVMQFVNQSEGKVGSEAPLLNAYANFRHKNTRFYIRMFNVGEILLSGRRLSMHNYAYNPMHLEAGLVVDLRN